MRSSLVCPAVRQQCFAMSSLRVRHANSSVVGYKNQHKCPYSVLRLCSVNRRDSGCILFLMTTCRLQFMLACVCVLIATRVDTRV